MSPQLEDRTATERHLHEALEAAEHTQTKYHIREALQLMEVGRQQR